MEEILRLIIYDFTTSNLLLLVKLNGKLSIHLFYLFKNLLIFIFCKIFIEKNNYFFLEIVTSNMFSFIFYIFKKIWEYKIRIIFSEKYKFENLIIYTNDLTKGLNRYQLNISSDFLIYYDKKFYNFLKNNLFLFCDNYCSKEKKFKNKIFNLKKNDDLNIKNNDDSNVKYNENLINNQKNDANILALDSKIELNKNNIKLKENLVFEEKNFNAFNNNNDILEESDKNLIIQNKKFSQ